MGDNDRNDPLVATDGRSRRRLGRLFFLAGLVFAGLVLAGFLFRDRLSHLWHSQDDQGSRFPSGVLADYVPEDSQVVLAVNMRQLREAPAGHQLAPALQQLIRRAGGRLHWLDLLGIHPIEDIDNLLISFAPTSGGEPVWLIRGRFDRSRMQFGPDALQETTLDRVRVWETTDRREKRTTIVAPVGDMLVISEARVRVQAALKQASNPRSVSVRDATLRELLTKVDRRQTVWLAAALKRLGPVLTEIDDYWLKLLLRPVLARAESVYGEIQCAEDVRAELHLRSATEEEAIQLEKSLENLRALAGEGASLLVRRKEWQPLLRLLSAGEIHRDGTMILLRCRWSATTEPEA